MSFRITVETTKGHTPGPWTVMQKPAPSREDHGWRAMAMCGSWMVAAPSKVAFKQWDNEANARLIAAAPDLLAAAKHVLAILDHPHQSVSILDADKLRDAIAKAETVR